MPTLRYERGERLKYQVVLLMLNVVKSLTLTSKKGTCHSKTPFYEVLIVIFGSLSVLKCELRDATARFAIENPSVLCQFDHDCRFLDELGAIFL